MARGANQFGPYGTGKSRQASGAKKKNGLMQTSSAPYLKHAKKSNASFAKAMRMAHGAER